MIRDLVLQLNRERATHQPGCRQCLANRLAQNRFTEWYFIGYTAEIHFIHMIIPFFPATDLKVNQWFIAEQHNVVMDYRPSYPGIAVVPLLFTFYHATEGTGGVFEILREVSFEYAFNPTICESLKPTALYERPKKDRSDRKLEVIDSEFRPDFM